MGQQRRCLLTMVENLNSKFLEVCESMNIRVITTAAESRFSNGLIERHDLIIPEMLDKTLEDTGAYFQLVLAWRVNRKTHWQMFTDFLHSS